MSDDDSPLPASSHWHPKDAGASRMEARAASRMEASRQLHADFIVKNGLFGFQQLKEAYNNCSTVGNGHCAIDGLTIGLHGKGKLSPLIRLGASYNQLSDREQRQDLRLWRRQLVAHKDWLYGNTT